MAGRCTFKSGVLELHGYLAVPTARHATGTPAVVLCHSFRAGEGGAPSTAFTHPQLADRIAQELGWVALSFTCRGAGESEGQFSLGGWLSDILAAIGYVAGLPAVTGVWAAGFGTGGALCLCAGARDRRVKGVAVLGAPADFEDWGGQPRRLLEHAREVGLVSDRSFPASFDAWVHDLRAIRPLHCVADYAPRPLLVVHGTDDDLVPDFDARVIADAHGSAEMRILAGASHQLRDDPRSIAVLLGWLDRERHVS
ncbi:MAG TPA: alpha/beta hydrolase [Acidimicrobiales bacterium]|jgi:putative redox protein